MTGDQVAANLERDLKPFLKPGITIEVDADDDGVLKAFKIMDEGRSYFTVYGGDFTWEARKR